jgi:hypothetical protein
MCKLTVVITTRGCSTRLVRAVCKIRKPYTSMTLRFHAKNISGEFPGRRWHKNFQQRHPVFVPLKLSKLDPKRAKNFNKYIVGDYYDKQEDSHDKHDGIPS